MQTITEIITEAAEVTDAEIEAVREEIERQAAHKAAIVASLEGHKADIIAQADYTIDRLKYRLSLLHKQASPNIGIAAE